MSMFNLTSLIRSQQYILHLVRETIISQYKANLFYLEMSEMGILKARMEI